MAENPVGSPAARRRPEPPLDAEWLGGESYGNIGWPPRTSPAAWRSEREQATAMARRLGWFSIGLGLAEVVAPRWLGRQIGVGSRPWLLRMFGMREIATGAALLSQEQPRTAMWGRVGGDALDLAALAGAYRASRRKGRLLAAVGAVVGVTLLDARTARRL